MPYERQEVVLTVMDAFQRTKTKRVELVTTDPAQGLIDADLIRAAYQAVMDGAIVKMAVRSEDDVAAVAAAGANVDAGCTCSVRLYGGIEKATLKWPAPALAKFLTGGILDTSDLDVQAVEALYENGGIALLSDGQAIESILSGVLDK